MDWLKDKKNQPIIVTVLAVIIVGAAAAIYFTMFAGGGEEAATDYSSSATVPADSTGAPAGTNGVTPGAPTQGPTAPGGYMPGGPSGGAAATTASAPAPTSGAKPMEAWREDPFLPLDYKPPPKAPKVKPKPRIPDLPIATNFSRWVAEKRKQPAPDLEQPVRRMAGIVQSDRIYAIIETVGKPNMEIVQPGDVLEDRLAKVERIERDRVILRTMDKVPKFITVWMTPSPKTTSGSTAPPPGSESYASPPVPDQWQRGRRYDSGVAPTPM